MKINVCSFYQKHRTIPSIFSNINQSRELSQANIRGYVSAAVFILIIISLLKSRVPSHSWNYNGRYVCRRWLYKQCVDSLGSCLGHETPWQWYSSRSGTCFLNLCVIPAWKSSECTFGIIGILDPSHCCHPHMQHVVFHLWAGSWVQTLHADCWAM